MRFALCGEHSDGIAMARAVAANGHSWAAVCAVQRPSFMAELCPDARHVTDFEELLADPEIQAVIVASKLSVRLNDARRVLQSERHAVVVTPVDRKPDGAFELAMLQGDVHQVLLPILPLTLSADFERLRTASPPQLIAFEAGLLSEEDEPFLPLWDVLRRLGGEIAELGAFQSTEEWRPNEPTLLFGRFEAGGLIQGRIATRGAPGPWKITRDEGPPTTLAADEASFRRLADAFDQAIARLTETVRALPAASDAGGAVGPVTWLDAIRAAELDDAVLRSVHRRRTSILDYQEANEEVGFKGTMTLVGCGMLWLSLVILVAAAFWPPLFWLIVPMIFGFLALQAFRWVIPNSANFTTPRQGESDIH